MERAPEADPLDLWRGIDDAIWREATRALAVQPRTRLVPPPALRRWTVTAQEPAATALQPVAV
jgi:hypothetical protein